MIEVVAIADDLTGALESGAAFADAGIQAVVLTNLPDLKTTICGVAVNARSRHETSAEAARIVAQAATQARLSGAKWLYKKTDSTLRGHIGAELSAAVESWPGCSLMYVPAYPALGRTVRNGRLYVDNIPVEQTSFANDPLSPVLTGWIARVIAKEYTGRVRQLTVDDPLPGDLEPAIYICDGTTEEHVRHRASEAVRSERLLAAGPAGFLREWLRGLPIARNSLRRRPAANTGLIVNGSLHPRSREQVKRFRSSWAVLESAEEREPHPSAPARRLASEAASILRRDCHDALVVIGGETAQAILDELNISELIPLGELLPGVPASEARLDGRPLIVISKAGGFGPPDVLIQIHRALRG